MFQRLAPHSMPHLTPKKLILSRARSLRLSIVPLLASILSSPRSFYPHPFHGSRSLSLYVGRLCVSVPVLLYVLAVPGPPSIVVVDSVFLQPKHNQPLYNSHTTQIGRRISSVNTLSILAICLVYVAVSVPPRFVAVPSIHSFIPSVGFVWRCGLFPLLSVALLRSVIRLQDICSQSGAIWRCIVE